MNVIKFTLSGNTAFFKKPEVNAYSYFTYGCIHKITLLGILGAICGYGGYNQQQDSDKEFPEFYNKFKDIKVGIRPRNDKGYIPKKIQVFNNSVGYASKEEGGNLIVKEQWLENPKWDIYVQITQNTEELAKRIIDKRFEYIPYLGKNDHIADLMNVELIKAVQLKDVDYIDSLFLGKDVEIIKNDDLFDFDLNMNLFKYEEILPISLEKTTNNYESDIFIFTNNKVKDIKGNMVYECNGQSIYFF